MIFFPVSNALSRSPLAMLFLRHILTSNYCGCYLTTAFFILCHRCWRHLFWYVSILYTQLCDAVNLRHPGQLSLAIPRWVGPMSTSESWDVNRHTVVSQCKLVSGWWLNKRRSAPPYVSFWPSDVKKRCPCFRPVIIPWPTSSSYLSPQCLQCYNCS